MVVVVVMVRMFCVGGCRGGVRRGWLTFGGVKEEHLQSDITKARQITQLLIMIRRKVEW